MASYLLKHLTTAEPVMPEFVGDNRTHSTVCGCQAVLALVVRYNCLDQKHGRSAPTLRHNNLFLVDSDLEATCRCDSNV